MSYIIYYILHYILLKTCLHLHSSKDGADAPQCNASDVTFAFSVINTDACDIILYNSTRSNKLD